MSKDGQVYCKACHICTTRKSAVMHRYDVGFPMEEIAKDLMGPFPESDSGGKKQFLVVVDNFLRWIEAYPVPNIETQTVAEKLVLEFISRFVVLFQIKSD